VQTVLSILATAFLYTKDWRCVCAKQHRQAWVEAYTINLFSTIPMDLVFFFLLSFPFLPPYVANTGTDISEMRTFFSRKQRERKGAGGKNVQNWTIKEREWEVRYTQVQIITLIPLKTGTHSKNILHFHSLIAKGPLNRKVFCIQGQLFSTLKLYWIQYYCL
jgi:hypothetical protein